MTSYAKAVSASRVSGSRPNLVPNLGSFVAGWSLAEGTDGTGCTKARTSLPVTAARWPLACAVNHRPCRLDSPFSIKCAARFASAFARAASWVSRISREVST